MNEYILQSLRGKTILETGMVRTSATYLDNLNEHRGKPDPVKVAEREAMRKRGEERRKNAAKRREEEEAARAEREKRRAERERQQRRQANKSDDNSELKQQNHKLQKAINDHSSKIAKETANVVSESRKQISKIKTNNESQQKIVAELDKTIGLIANDIDVYKESLINAIDNQNLTDMPGPEEAIDAIVTNRYNELNDKVQKKSSIWDDEYDDEDWEYAEYDDEYYTSKSSESSDSSVKSVSKTSTNQLLNNAKVEKYTDRKLRETRQEAAALKAKYKSIIDGLKSKTGISEEEKEERIREELRDYARKRDKLNSDINKLEDEGSKNMISHFVSKNFKAAAKPFIALNSVFNKLIDAADVGSSGFKSGRY